MEAGESTAELVYGSEPWNNGDYSWCEHCRGYVFIDFWEERTDAHGYPEYFHRGHSMQEKKSN